MKFKKKGKLIPRSIGPYEMLKYIRDIAYELDCASELTYVHLFLHVSMLKKFIGNASQVVPLEIFGVKDNISYEEILV